MKRKVTQKDSDFCRILSENIPGTAKGDIPRIVADGLPPSGDDGNLRFVLDVGCADGSLTAVIHAAVPEDVGVIGIEPNRTRCLAAWDRWRDAPGHERLSFLNTSFQEAYSGSTERFDAIVFSSVLHELASGERDSTRRYESGPIRDALEKAYKLLKPGGQLVIRDFVRPHKWEDSTRRIRFRNKASESRFLQYFAECPFVYTTPGAPYLMNIFRTTEYTEFEVRGDILLEFLLCWTWGPKSWNREIKERKLVLSQYEWRSTLEECGFRDIHVKTSAEGYPQHFDRIVKDAGQASIQWPAVSGLVTARK